MQPDPLQRPTWAEVDLDALAFNYHSIRDFVGRGVEFMSVIKADAYGHGAVRCARRLEAEGSDWFGVATVEEGIELRDAGIVRPILILGGFWPGQAAEAIRRGLTPIIFTLNELEAIDHAAGELHRKLPIHIKIDTGMGRVGFRYDDAAAIADHLPAFENLEIEGIMTHFASADDMGSDFTETQISRFQTAVDVFRARGINPRYTDMANSPAAVRYPETRTSMVRIGGILFGLKDDTLPKGIDAPEIRPVMSMRTRIAQLKTVPAGETIGYERTYRLERESLIATVPVGYNDGLRRGLSNKAHMLVGGVKALIAGRVSMDWTSLDVTDVPSAAEGDVVTILGSDSGGTIRASDLAAAVSTISYEITCGISSRVPRIYKEENTQ